MTEPTQRRLAATFDEDSENYARVEAEHRVTIHYQAPEADRPRLG